MEKQMEPSMLTSKGGGGGGGRGDSDVEEIADDKQRLSPAPIFTHGGHERNKMEKERLDLDLVLSNDLIVRDRRVRPHMNFFDLKETTTTSTSPTSSQGRTSGGEVSGQLKRSAGVQPVKVDDDAERKMKMAYLTRSVFSNSLITSRIWPHLNFADLKASREVSWDFFDKITSFRRFKKSVVLQVTKESVEVPGLFDKNASSMTQTWHGIQIDVALPLDVLDKIRHILETVQFVSLVLDPHNPQDADFVDENYAKFIANVLSSSPKLTCLEMDVRLLENDFSQVWSCHVIRHHLRNLESLELPHVGLESNATGKVYTERGGPVSDPYFFIPEESATSLQELATALETALPRLKRLRVSKFTIGEYDISCGTEGRPFVISFLDLIRSHRGSLVEVSIFADVWNDPDDMATVIMPHLKSLTTTVYTADTVNFETFLMHHPKLEELDLDVNHDYSDNDNVDFWKAIKRHCSSAAGGGAYLKKVHLKTEQCFWTCFGDNGVGVVLDWSFLEEMKALEDFQVEISLESRSETYRHALGIGPRVLECLPRNQLTRLSLNGIHFGGSFWRSSPEDREDVVGEEVPLAIKLDLLRKFKNLKRLSFRHSSNAVDDDVIQFIFREMTALEELEVSQCSRLTDVGIAGTRAEGEEDRVSIQSLKDLKLLSIRDCPSVTPEGLLSVLALPFLQHFDYYSRRPVPKSFVRGIAAQNPSLESISVHTTGDSDDPGPNPSLSSSTDIDNCAWSSAEKKAFFDKHPRIKALHNLKSLGRDGEYASDDSEEED